MHSNALRNTVARAPLRLLALFLSLRLFPLKTATGLMLCIATGFALLPATGSYAQSGNGVRLDFGFGLERTTLDGAIPLSSGPLSCEVFDGGSGRLIRIEGGAAIPWPIIGNLELYAGLGLSRSSLVMTVDPVTPFWTFDPLSGNEVELSRRFDRELSWNRVAADLIVRYRLFNAFSVGVGISPGAGFGLASRQTENLTDDEDFTFNDGNRYRTLPGEAVLTLAPMSLDLLGTLGYRLGITSSIDLRLEAKGGYELLPLFLEHDAKTWYVGGTIGLSYHLPASTKDSVPHVALSPAPEISSIDTSRRRLPLQLTPPQRNELSAEIDLHALDEAGERRDSIALVIDEITHIEQDVQSGRKETRTERHVNPPVVQIDPSYQADAGLRRWEIVLRYNDSVIARRTSEEVGKEESQPDWQAISAGEASTVQRLEVSFYVEDSTGGSKTARTELPMTTVRCRRVTLHETGSGGSEKWFYSIPECLDPVEATTPRTEEVLREISANVREGGTLRLLAPASADTSYSLQIVSTLRTLLKERGVVEYSIDVGSFDDESGSLLRNLPEASDPAPRWGIVVHNRL